MSGIVNGDPDVDAIFRLTKTFDHRKIDIQFDETSPSVQYPLFRMSPFNSQSTQKLLIQTTAYLYNCFYNFFF